MSEETNAVYNAGEDIIQQYADLDLEGMKRACVNWINTAAMHSRNEDYWRERCLKAEHAAPTAPAPEAVSMDDDGPDFGELNAVQTRLETAWIGLEQVKIAAEKALETVPRGYADELMEIIAIVDETVKETRK